MQISYVNIFVTDLEKAIAFCRERLELALQFSSPEHGYASFSAGAVRLGVSLPGEDQVDLVGRHTGVGLEVADPGAEAPWRSQFLGFTVTRGDHRLKVLNRVIASIENPLAGPDPPHPRPPFGRCRCRRARLAAWTKRVLRDH